MNRGDLKANRNECGHKGLPADWACQMLRSTLLGDQDAGCMGLQLQGSRRGSQGGAAISWFQESGKQDLT
jgi:hypothetical protein